MVLLLSSGWWNLTISELQLLFRTYNFWGSTAENTYDKHYRARTPHTSHQMSQGRKGHMAWLRLKSRTSRIPCEHSDHWATEPQGRPVCAWIAQSVKGYPDSSVGKAVCLTTSYIPLPHGFESCALHASKKYRVVKKIPKWLSLAGLRCFHRVFPNWTALEPAVLALTAKNKKSQDFWASISRSHFNRGQPGAFRQGEVLVQILDFPICSIHLNFTLSLK